MEPLEGKKSEIALVMDLARHRNKGVLPGHLGISAAADHSGKHLCDDFDHTSQYSRHPANRLVASNVEHGVLVHPSPVYGLKVSDPTMAETAAAVANSDFTGTVSPVAVDAQAVTSSDIGADVHGGLREGDIQVQFMRSPFRGVVVEGNADQLHARDSAGIGSGSHTNGTVQRRPAEIRTGVDPDGLSKGGSKGQNVSVTFEEKFRQQFKRTEDEAAEVDFDADLPFQPPPFKRQRSNSDTSLQVRGRGGK